MCLAEALLRIPDGETADRLIADKIPSGAWDEHLGDSDSLLVNASTWGLMLTGRVVALDRNEVGEARSGTRGWSAKLGEPVARAALKQAMRILGHQFVMGRDIEARLTRAAGKEERDYRYSFDMLGEAALTARGRRALSREVLRRHRGRGPCGRDARIDHGAPQHLDQAVGAASRAMSSRRRRACMRRARTRSSSSWWPRRATPASA